MPEPLRRHDARQALQQRLRRAADEAAAKLPASTLETLARLIETLLAPYRTRPLHSRRLPPRDDPPPAAPLL